MELMEKEKMSFKKTTVGIIPKDWEITNLDQIGKFSKGQGVRKDEAQSGNISCVRYGEIYTKHNNYIKEFYSFISTEVSQTARKIKYGDLLFAGSGETKEEIGKTVAFTKRIDAFAGGDIVILSISNLDKHSPLYLGYLLNTPPVQRAKASLGQGDAVVHISSKALQKVEVAMPPTLEEQQAIATALSDTDALIAGLEKLISKKKAIKQGAMQHLLTPPQKGGKRLPGFDGEWEEKRLGEIADVKTGSRNNQDKIEGGLYPFYVRSQTVERINSYSYDGEAILIPGEGGIGTIFHYINGKFDVHQRVYKISGFSQNVIGKFIYNQLVHNFYDHAMKNSVKATVDSLRLPTFQEFEINLPPDPYEQSAIVGILDDMEKDIEALESKKAKYEQVKQGMMQELLTGKTRMV